MDSKGPLTPPSTTENNEAIIPQFQHLLSVFKDFVEKNQILELVSAAEDSDLQVSGMQLPNIIVY